MNRLTVFTLVLFAASGASAHEPRLLELLASIDQVPSAEALQAAVAKPTAALLAVAADEAQPLYYRERAATLVSVVPARDAGVALLAVADASKAPRVRWAAAYTAVRAFGATEPAVLDGALRWLRSSEPGERDAVIRGLAWVPGTRAAALLDEAERRETSAELRRVIANAKARRTR